MSLKTWKEEFYPKDANSEFTEIEAIEHSLNKWIGLRKENLKKHECSLMYDDYYYTITFGISCLEINGNTCSLCVKYKERGKKNHCCSCPLYDYLGGRGCDYKDQPYYRFIKTKNPKPMIKALTGCLGKAKP